MLQEERLDSIFQYIKQKKICYGRRTFTEAGSQSDDYSQRFE